LFAVQLKLVVAFQLLCLKLEGYAVAKCGFSYHGERALRGMCNAGLIEVERQMCKAEESDHVAENDAGRFLTRRR